MPKSFFKNEINVNESLLDKGLKVIIQAFNEQKNVQNFKSLLNTDHYVDKRKSTKGAGKPSLL